MYETLRRNENFALMYVSNVLSDVSNFVCSNLYLVIQVRSTKEGLNHDVVS